MADLAWCDRCDDETPGTACPVYRHEMCANCEICEECDRIDRDAERDREDGDA